MAIGFAWRGSVGIEYEMKQGVRRAVFAFGAVVIASLVALGTLLAADIYVHTRALRSAGLNVWGYRGPVVGRKQPGETRVVVLGGSTAFGYGGTWQHAFPTRLEERLNATQTGKYSVVNLGYNSEGAYSFRFTLQDFAYLKYDIVILYEGYNDILGDTVPNLAVYRHDSPVFRMTGYFPILPLAFREKAMALRRGGSINGAYEGSKVVFEPGLSVRMSAAVLDAASKISESVERQLDRVSTEQPRAAARATGGCEFPWNHYCASIATAIDYALVRHAKVLVGAQPRMTAELTRVRHDEQQHALQGMLSTRFSGNPAVAYVDLRDTIDLRDLSIAPDGMHLDDGGNQTIASHLVGPVLELLGRRASSAGLRP